VTAMLSTGDRVVFETDGFGGAGIVDDAMPDGSVIWVWTDDGMGRRMICTKDGASIAREDGESWQSAR
jgi:hypothetical protein